MVQKMSELVKLTANEYMNLNKLTKNMLGHFPAVKKTMLEESITAASDDIPPDVLGNMTAINLNFSSDTKKSGCVSGTLSMSFANEKMKKRAANTVKDKDFPPIYDSVTSNAFILDMDGQTVIPLSWGEPVTATNVVDFNANISTGNIGFSKGYEGILCVTSACERDSVTDYYAVMDVVSLGEPEYNGLVEPDKCKVTLPVSTSDVTTPKFNQIKIMYARTTQDTEHPDQTTDYEYADNNKAGDLQLLIPFEFSVLLSKNVKIREVSGVKKPLATVDEIKAGSLFPDKFKLVRPSFYDIDIGLKDTVNRYHYFDQYDGDHDQEYLDKGLLHCVTTGSEIVGDVTYETLKVSFSGDGDNWFHNIGKNITNTHTTSSVKSTVKFAVTDANGNNKILTVLVYSMTLQQLITPAQTYKYYTLYPGGTNQYNFYIPPIFIWWGCFAEDVKIKLASGEIKRADRICVGDIVKTGDGHTATVGNVYTGTDEYIMVIVTENDRVTRVSMSHPMCTNLYENTFRAAKDFNPGDKLIQEDGSETTIRHIDKVPYGRKVFNFSFNEYEDEGCAILGDGIWSGDLIAQNTCERKAFEAAQAKRAQEPQSPPTDFASELAELLKAAAKAQR
jgi:hypothetical protein